MKYTIDFTGRKAGAIGITYRVQAAREADTEHDAIMKLYDEYEHISQPVIISPRDLDKSLTHH